MITYEQFSQAELRVATVLAVERVEGSDKLLRLRISLREDSRQIIAGIGKKYAPENLIGKQIIIVANLEPRMIMGLESQGMLLAADSASGPVLLVPEQETAPGAKIK